MEDITTGDRTYCTKYIHVFEYEKQNHTTTRPDQLKNKCICGRINRNIKIIKTL